MRGPRGVYKAPKAPTQDKRALARLPKGANGRSHLSLLRRLVPFYFSPCSEHWEALTQEKDIVSAAGVPVADSPQQGRALPWGGQHPMFDGRGEIKA